MVWHWSFHGALLASEAKALRQSSYSLLTADCQTFLQLEEQGFSEVLFHTYLFLWQLEW